MNTGYGVIENFVRSYERMEKKETKTPQILIAPSYQDGNILDSCIDSLPERLLPLKYIVVVGPHPQYLRRAPQKIEVFQNVVIPLNQPQKAADKGTYNVIR